MYLDAQLRACIRNSSLALVVAVGHVPPVMAQSITVYGSGSLALGGSRQLTAYVPLTPASVTWSVNGVVGGNSVVGTISTAGLYRAPTAMPAPHVVTVRATSTAFSNISGAAQVSVTQIQPRLWSISPATVAPGNFTISISGANFPASMSVKAGDQVLSVTRVSSTQLLATGSAASSAVGTSLPVQIWAAGPGAVGSDVVRLAVATTAPSPAPAPAPSPAPAPAPAPAPIPGQGTANLAAARFLEQASFGPNMAAVTRLRQIGQEAWLNEQFALPESVVSNPGGQSMGAVAQEYLARLTDAPDQLRQRVAYALAQVLVISANKNIYPDELVPHLRTLSSHAFGNYRTLLEQVTRSSQMGKYLDLANSNRPVAGSAANENYARELLQLFTIGLVKLNMDGSPQLDLSGKPLPTYDQATIQQVALAFTGWTYAGSGANNWENFSGPLVYRDFNHDSREKRFLGCTLAGGQGADADLRATLDCIYQHPNLPPFVSLRLIRQLVKSNPSPAYVQRVAQVFANDGSGVRGNLRAVVRAILLDAEARVDTAGANDGRLRDPIQHIAAALRGLGGGFRTGNSLAWDMERAGQRPLTPPSVFGHYSQLFRLPQTSLAAPEFQIYTPTQVTLRANLLWSLLTQPGAQARIDLSPFTAVAGDTAALVNQADQVLLWGRMPAAMRQSLALAINAQPDATQRVHTAIYLTLLSGFHAVQH